MFCAAFRTKHHPLKQWNTTEDFDISDLIQFIQLRRVDFLQTT